MQHTSAVVSKPREPLVMERSGNHIPYLATRGISAPTAERLGVFSAKRFISSAGREVECVGFPYSQQGEVYAAKFRAFPDKGFSCYSAPATFFGVEQALDSGDLFIVEGECFPGDAQVLTPTGWANLDTIGSSDMVAQWEESGSITFVRPTAIVRKPFEGALVSLSVKGWSSITTPNHNLLEYDYKGRLRKTPAHAYPVLSTALIPRVGFLDGPGIPLSYAQITLCLAVAADATVDHRSGTGPIAPRAMRYCRVGLKKERKVSRLRGALVETGVEFKESSDKRGCTTFQFSLPDWAPGKLLPWSWVANASAEQREFILDEMVNWDGNSVSGRSQTEFSSKHEDQAMWMQAMAHTSGRCSSVMRRSNAHGAWYKASILHNKKTTSCQAIKRDELEFSGEVFCVTVPSGMIMVRQNGHVTVSGNCDALSMVESGLNCVSVPNGAPMKVSANNRLDPSEDGKFRFVWAAKALLDKVARVILATDMDDAGDALREELARRIGKDKCWVLDWPDGVKDANDFLVGCIGAFGREEGITKFKSYVDANVKPWPVAGLHSAAEFFTDLSTLYDDGLPPGESTGWAGVDEIVTVQQGLLYIVTGIPGSGKSTWMDNVLVNLSERTGWKHAVASFENPTALHIAKLSAIRMRKPFKKGPTSRMTKEEMFEAANWVDEHFLFLGQDGVLPTVDSIIERGRHAVMRHGVRTLLIDPMNFIQLDDAENGTEAINKMLSQLKLFAQSHGCAVVLVAHPAKPPMQRKEGWIPTGYDISGSAHFYNRTDMGLTVARDKGGLNRVVCWKARHSHIGSVGEAVLSFDIATGRFDEGNIEDKDIWDADF